MKKQIIAMFLLCASVFGASAASPAPKREFRGAWIHTVHQGQYKKNGTEGNKRYLISQLDSLKAMGVNAVIFQVRPQADAFYNSKLEPWSIYLTDGGQAPTPYWDPLQFMIEEAHKRGMELHAWLNPYRVTASSNQNGKLPKNHIYHKHPEWFVNYGDKLYFDPALPQSREYIGKVVDDIVARYDVDGIHFDDYFYPYPIAGKEFPDSASYAKYGKGMDRGDWRRKNVDLLIEDLHKRITAAKPWVRFGISPFGIYRNKKTDPMGSNTNGLQNYDALFADVLLWERNGWIDYLLPQLYWEREHKAASYDVLVDWWNGVAGQNRHLYIGQDVVKCMKKKDLAPSTEASQLRTKVEMTRNAANIQGNCWWPAYSLTANVLGVADSLRYDIQAHPALVPAYTWISSTAPAAIKNIKPQADGSFAWTAPKAQGKTEDVVRYAVYRFDALENADITNASGLVDVINTPYFKPTESGVYIITALDRVNNESAPSDPIVVK